MKVIGGIQGIANNLSALQRYFMIAPEMSLLLDEFCSIFNIVDSDYNRQEHYQFTGSTNDRIDNNVLKLLDVFDEFNIDFDETDELSNVITNVVLSKEAAEEFLNFEECGAKSYEIFKKERLQGNKSVWDTLPKSKLKTFDDTLKRTSVKLKDQVINLKQDRKMMARLIIASRKREEIDLPYYLGVHEFSVVPLSMFDYHGDLLIGGRDKSSVTHGIEQLIAGFETPDCEVEAPGFEIETLESEYVPESEIGIADSEVRMPVSEIETPDWEIPITDSPTETIESKRVIIFDAMAIVQSIKKTASMKTVKDFAEVFKTRIIEGSAGFEEVRVVFDRYLIKSLKNQTRKKRTGGKVLQYKVDENTSLEKTQLKDFLSHIETKRELTIYLSNYIAPVLQAANKNIMSYMRLFVKQIYMISTVKC